MTQATFLQKQLAVDITGLDDQIYQQLKNRFFCTRQEISNHVGISTKTNPPVILKSGFDIETTRIEVAKMVNSEDG